MNAGLPNITGSGTSKYFASSVGNSTNTTMWEDTEGALYADMLLGDRNFINADGGTNKSANCRLNLDASRSSSIYGNSTTVQPPAVTVNFIVKY